MIEDHTCLDGRKTIKMLNRIGGYSPPAEAGGNVRAGSPAMDTMASIATRFSGWFRVHERATNGFNRFLSVEWAVSLPGSFLQKAVDGSELVIELIRHAEDVGINAIAKPESWTLTVAR